MLSIYLLGQPRLAYQGQPVPVVALPKTWPLLAYLLLQLGHPVSRQTLAFTLWPDAAEARGRANLRRHLHALRHMLPPSRPAQDWLLITPQTIQWNPQAEYWLDVAEFERGSATAATLDAAVALYTGDFLANVYDDWLFYERERLRNLYLADLNQLTRACRAGHDYPQAIAYARRLLENDPLREDVLRHLMAVQYEAGDRSGSLQEYERFARHLREELAVEPMPETAALHGAIIRNTLLPDDPELRQTVPHDPAHTPPLVLPFVGRDTEMAQLRGCWSRAARGQGGLVLVGGEAGIGKTRLAAHLGVQAAQEGARVLRGSTTFAEPIPYQALVAALRGAVPLLAALDIDPLWLAALAALVPELRTRRESGAERLPLLAPLDPERERTRLFEGLARCLEGLAQPRPLLLILEDLHWAGAATAGLLEFLARRAGQHALLIVITYRAEETPRAHPLRDLRRRLEREQQLQHLALGPLPLAALEDLVAQVPQLGPVTGAIAHQLYAASEGQPFFLGELIREVLEAAPGVPPTSAAGAHEPVGPAAPRGVRTLIAARLARLSAEAQALAEVAAVAGTAFALELVGEVSGWEESQLLARMDELIDGGLVHELVGHSQADYAFTHYLVQAAIYAEMPSAQAVRRHRRLAQAMEEIYAGHLDDLAAELARHFDRGHEPEQAAHYYLAAAHRALGVYADEEARRYLSRGLEIARDPARRFDLLALRESIDRRQGHRSAQLEDLQQLEALADALADEERLCAVLARRIVLQSLLGERPAEAALIGALKQRAAASGALHWQAYALKAAADYQVLLSQYEAAQASLEQALALRQAINDLPGQVECYALLAEVAAYRGRFAEAQTLLQEAIALAGATANQSLLVRTLRAACIAAVVQVEIDTAHTLGLQMLELCRSIGDREGEADAHTRVASAASRLFHVEEARRHYEQAQGLYALLGNRRGQAAVLVNAGMLAANLGQYAAAITATRRAEQLFKAIKDRRGQTVCLVNIAEHALRQGDYRTALASGARGLRLARTIQSTLLEAYALANLGAAELELGQAAPAIAHMEAGLKLRRAAGQAAVELATDLCDLTVAYLRAGRLPAAQQAADEMLHLLAADAAHMTYPQFILWAAAQTYRALGQPERAQALLVQANQVLREKTAAIPDPESRATFAQLPYNREMLAAAEQDRWP